MMRSLMVTALLVSSPAVFACASPNTTTLASPVQAQEPQQQPQSGAADQRPGIAVLLFDNGGSVGDKPMDYSLLPLGLQRSLMHELSNNTSLRLVDRSTLKSLLAEQDLSTSGRVSPETAVRIGRLVGAKYIVSGSFTDNFGEFQLNGHITDGETGEVLKAAQSQGDRKKYYQLVVDMASQITKNVKLPELPKQVREAQSKRDVPVEAMMRYSMITSLEDEGQKDRAIALYKDLVKDFPQMENWKEELRQLSGG